MKIDFYTFGRIVINGKTYTSDVIIYPGRVNAAWWRKEGHLLRYAGVMRVPRETIDGIAAQGIEVKVERTSKAAEVYNDLQGDRTVIAALHITC